MENIFIAIISTVTIVIAFILSSRFNIDVDSVQYDKWHKKYDDSQFTKSYTVGKPFSRDFSSKWIIPKQEYLKLSFKKYFGFGIIVFGALFVIVTTPLN